MKALKHTLCILLAALMLLSAAPAESVISLYNGFTALAANGHSLEVDYNAVSKQTLTDAIKSNVAYNNFYESEAYFQSLTDYPWQWRHTSTLTAYDSQNDGLRKYLQSTSPYDTYIVLDGNADCHPTKSAIDPIVITTDKVLDLNGYTISMRDDTNMSNSGYHQALGPEFHRSHLFEIKKGAKLTIIDSSRWRYNRFGKGGDDTGTGKISMTGRMIYPFEHDITTYTIRDLFWILDGTLITYGGTYQAGRQKYQSKKKFSWSKLKTCIGTAVELGVNIASYATGIDAATSAQKDLTAAFKNQTVTDNPDDDGLDDLITSTKKRTGADAPKEELQDSSSGGREKSVGEKNEGAKEGNAGGTAKKENAQMAESRKNVTDSVLNQSSIGKMVDGVFNLVEGIADMIGEDYGSRVTGCIHGTPVHLGTDGTFVCYGGYFKGYGSTPHTRDAVVEVTLVESNDALVENDNTGKWLGGQAYIYGGTFEGNAGANIFNFVKSDSSAQQVQSVTKLDSGSKGYNTYNLQITETNGLKILHDVGGAPVSTKNVTVRGGVFRNYYELMMVSAKEPDTDQHFTKFPGTPGGLGLGVDSFGEDMIRDGRIQIIDNYGDGNLVLMNESKNPDEKVYHYRLFCSDLELRYKQYIQVEPNRNTANTTHTFHLVSVSSDNNEDISTGWTSEDGNQRTGPLNQTETVFSYPLDSIATGIYYVMPELDAANSSGEGIEQSSIWYYQDPVDTAGVKYPRLRKHTAVMYGTSMDGKTNLITNQEESTEKTWNANRAAAQPGSLMFADQAYWFHTNVKWFSYRIYRVDPLTRKNISESSAYGSDVPLCELVYGVNTSNLQCKITLAELEKHMKKTVSGFTGYKPGEMYRITLTMEEHLSYDMHHYNTKYDWSYQPWFGTELPVAKATSSILFKCYSTNELSDMGGKLKDINYTALQWDEEPVAGQYASVRIVNGMAGKTDYLARKIFDVYYQWYAVDDKGKETMIAGTDNIYYKEAGKADHTYEHWNVGHDGKTYVNTVDPNDPEAKNYGKNGLPVNQNDWSDEMLHAYTHEMTSSKRTLSIDKSRESSPDNNLVYATNTDRCYIPAELAGQKIYCKVTVVNAYWPKEFDSVQVFYSHPVQLEGEPEPEIITPTVFVMPKTGSVNMISAEDPCTIGIGSLNGLKEGETVTSVVYVVNGKSIGFHHLGATIGNQLPTVKFPQDFYPAGYDLTKIPPGEMKCYAFISTSLKRGEPAFGNMIGFFTDKTKTFRFDVKTTALRFADGTPEEITVSLTDQNNKEALANALQAYYYPYNATYGSNYFKAGKTFSSDDPKIATLDSTGALTLGGDYGRTIIRLSSPDGTVPTVTVNVTKEIGEIEISGIEAPTVGEKFDFTAEVPENALYSVKNVRWIDVTDNNKELDSKATAQDYHYYTVEADVEPAPYAVIAPKAPMRMLLGAPDGGILAADAETKGCAVLTEEDDSGNISNVHFTYTYSTVKGGYMGSVVQFMFMEFPIEIAEGAYVDDWKDAFSFATNLEDGILEDLQINVTPRRADDALPILDALGYPHGITRINRFIKGVQTGFSMSVNLPEGVTFASNFKFYVNGKPFALNTAANSFGETYLSAVLDDSITVTDGTPLEPYTEIYRVKDFNLCANGSPSTLYLNQDLLDGITSRNVWLVGSNTSNPAAVSYSTYQNIYTNDINFNRYRTIYTALQPAEKVRIPIYAQVDVDNDRHYDLVFDHSVIKQIYDTSIPAPVETTEHSYTVRVMNPDGTLYHSQSLITYDNLYSELKLPPDTMVKRVTNSGGTEYALENTGNLNFPAGDTSSLFIVETAPAACGALNAGKEEVVVSPSLQCMLYSTDGEHWTTANRFTGLKSDEDHVLYYRQTALGAIYATAFHTAEETYGVWVGAEPVTNENRDLMPVNHWKYDPDTHTLTIDNLMLNSIYQDNAMIRAIQDLTIVVYGSNFFENSDPGKGYGIRVDGDLTLLGSGSLTFNGLQIAMVAKQKLTVKGSGAITIENTDYGIQFFRPYGVADFMNGSLKITPYTKNGDKYGDLLSGANANVTFENNYHRGEPLILQTRDAVNYNVSLTEEEFNDLTRDTVYLYYQTRHYGQKEEVQTSEYFAGVSCTESPRYYYRCIACGSVTTENPYSVPVSAHDIVKAPDQAPTCYTAGWKDYEYCTKCNYKKLTPLPATGHTWVTHAENDATCVMPGTPEYRECSVCGISTLNSALEADGKVFAPKNHNLLPVTATAATCTAAGTKAHYECTACHKLFADADAKKPMTADETTVPKTDHSYGEWTVTKHATETESGLKERECAVCGYKDTEEIEPESADAYMLGDVDNDSKITAGDARLALRRAVALETYPVGSKEYIACDVDKDGKVTANDARSILRAAVGLEDPKSW